VGDPVDDFMLRLREKHGCLAVIWFALAFVFAALLGCAMRRKRR